MIVAHPDLVNLSRIRAADLNGVRRSALGIYANDPAWVAPLKNEGL